MSSHSQTQRGDNGLDILLYLISGPGVLAAALGISYVMHSFSKETPQSNYTPIEISVEEERYSENLADKF